jgi:hypothetical protein
MQYRKTFYVLLRLGGGVRAGVATMQPFLKAKFRNIDFVAMVISRFGVIYVSA